LIFDICFFLQVKARPDASLLDNEKGDKVEAEAEEDETDTLQYK
jgi:hypothetical protein